MQGPNEWHDYFRILLILVAVFCFIMLLVRVKAGRMKWNEKTKDYWYAMTAWVISGGVILVQGILFDLDFNPGTVAVAAAILVTGRGLNRKGEWGGDQ